MKIESKVILNCKEHEAVKKYLIELSNQIDDLRKKLPDEVVQEEVADLLFYIDENLEKIIAILLDEETKKLSIKQLIRTQRIYNQKYKQDMEIKYVASNLVSDPDAAAELIKQNIDRFKKTTEDNESDLSKF